MDMKTLCSQSPSFGNTEGQNDKKAVEEIPIGRFTVPFVWSAYFLSGMCSLLNWNVVLFLTNFLCRVIFKLPEVSNQALGVFHCVDIVVTSSLLYFGPCRPYLMLVGAMVNILGCICFAIGASIHNSSTAMGVVYLGCGLMGASTGFIQTTGVSTGCRMPRTFVPALIGGQGFAGLFLGGLSTLMSFAAFDMETREGVLGLVYTLCGIFVGLCLLQILTMFCSIRSPYMSQSMPVPKKCPSQTHAELETCVTALDCNETDESLLPRRSYKEIALDVWQPIIAVFCSLFFSLNIFPLVGPLNWNVTGNPKNYIIVLMTCFNISDFIGRLFCELGLNFPRFSCVLIPKKWILLPTFMRTIFYVPFFLAMKCSDTFWNSYPWLICVMLSMSFVGGWMLTWSLVLVGESVVRHSEKDLVCPFSVIVIISSVLSGLFLALLYV